MIGWFYTLNVIFKGDADEAFGYEGSERDVDLGTAKDGTGLPKCLGYLGDLEGKIKRAMAE